MNIVATVRRVIYHSKDNGYVVMAGSFEDKDVTLVGNITDPQTLEKENISFEGEWIEDKKYGKQFKFVNYESINGSLVFYLTKIVKAVSLKVAKELVEKYTEAGLINMLNTNPDELKKHKGIKEKKLDKIKSKWAKFKETQELGLLLSPFGIGEKTLSEIFNTFEDRDDTPEENRASSGDLFEPKISLATKVKENPYILTVVSGIGFKKADKIALGLGVEPFSDNRIGHCIDYVIKQYCEMKGNSCVEVTTLFGLLDEELEFHGQNEKYKQVLEKRIRSGDIVRLYGKEKITTKYFFELEDNILKYRLNSRQPFIGDVETFINQKEKDFGITLNEQQKDGVRLANKHSMIVLTGYAGTGKSTTSKMILDIVSTKYGRDEIICTAVSGIASQRIRDLTGYASATLQSLIFKKEMEGDGFPYKVLLLDEASMVSSPFFWKALKLVPKDGMIIIVGDAGQLQPIGAGNPFNDIIKLKLVPVVELTQIYRQKPTQAINFIANDVRKGVVPDIDGKYDDFRFTDVSIPNYFKLKNALPEKELKELREKNYLNILAKIREIAEGNKNQILTYRQDNNIKKFITHFQVISPMRIGVLGTDNLNPLLQDIFNGNSREKIKVGKFELRLHDKVLHIKNKNLTCRLPDSGNLFEQRIFNGMCGLLTMINQEEELLEVLYPNENVIVQYDFSDAEDLLTLGYSISIHKSQGMEYSRVVIPISAAHYQMLNNKLLYTAITRAKEMCDLVGEKYMFASGVKREDAVIRDTVMLAIGEEVW